MTDPRLLEKLEIKTFTVPWLFQELRAGKKTGTAVFEQDKLIKKVYFRGGDVLFAASNSNDDRLGEFLLRKGRITKTQFDQASATVIKTNKKLGAVLFEAGILSPKELIAQVKLQIKQIILDLFAWRTGDYRFETDLPADEIIPLQMSTGNVILEGVQALDWQIIRKNLPPMSTILRPSMDPRLIFQSADLTQDQKSILSIMDGAKNIEQICSLTGIGDYNTLKAVYLLLALRMAEIGELKTEEERRLAREAVREASSPVKEEAAPVQMVTRTMIEEAFEALQRQDDFQVLGVTKSAPAGEVKKIYFRLAKRYHPDRHFEPEMADMKEKLEALFSRIHNAYKRISAGEAVVGFVEALHTEKRAGTTAENYADNKVSAAMFFDNGVKEYAAGNYWGAADEFASAVRLNPVKANYLYYYGLALMRMPRRLHEAAEKLQQAMEIDPHRPDYAVELGNVYLKSGLKAKALDVYEAALRANPGSETILQAMRAAGATPDDKGRMNAAEIV